MDRIIIKPSLRIKLDKFVDILFQEQYFGFRESAQNYVNLIYDFIEIIPSKQLKLCKSPIFGKYYARYDNRKSKMQYFITYDKKDGRYIVLNIISPKTKEYSIMMGK